MLSPIGLLPVLLPAGCLLGGWLALLQIVGFWRLVIDHGGGLFRACCWRVAHMLLMVRIVPLQGGLFDRFRTPPGDGFPHPYSERIQMLDFIEKVWLADSVSELAAATFQIIPVMVWIAVFAIAALVVGYRELRIYLLRNRYVSWPWPGGFYRLYKKLEPSFTAAEFSDAQGWLVRSGRFRRPYPLLFVLLAAAGEQMRAGHNVHPLLRVASIIPRWLPPIATIEKNVFSERSAWYSLLLMEEGHYRPEGEAEMYLRSLPPRVQHEILVRDAENQERIARNRGKSIQQLLQNAS